MESENPTTWVCLEKLSLLHHFSFQLGATGKKKMLFGWSQEIFGNQSLALGSYVLRTPVVECRSIPAIDTRSTLG